MKPLFVLAVTLLVSVFGMAIYIVTNNPEVLILLGFVINNLLVFVLGMQQIPQNSQDSQAQIPQDDYPVLSVLPPPNWKKLVPPVLPRELRDFKIVGQTGAEW